MKTVKIRITSAPVSGWDTRSTAKQASEWEKLPQIVKTFAALIKRLSAVEGITFVDRRKGFITDRILLHKASLTYYFNAPDIATYVPVAKLFRLNPAGKHGGAFGLYGYSQGDFQIKIGATRDQSARGVYEVSLWSIKPLSDALVSYVDSACGVVIQQTRGKQLVIPKKKMLSPDATWPHPYSSKESTQFHGVIKEPNRLSYGSIDAYAKALCRTYMPYIIDDTTAENLNFDLKDDFPDETPYAWKVDQIIEEEKDNKGNPTGVKKDRYEIILHPKLLIDLQRLKYVMRCATCEMCAKALHYLIDRSYFDTEQDEYRRRVLNTKLLMYSKLAKSGLQVRQVTLDELSDQRDFNIPH